jgi:hypothetical protein
MTVAMTGLKPLAIHEGTYQPPLDELAYGVGVQLEAPAQGSVVALYYLRPLMGAL